MDGLDFLVMMLILNAGGMHFPTALWWGFSILAAINFVVKVFPIKK